MRYTRQIRRLGCGVRAMARWRDLVTAIEEGEPVRPGTSMANDERGGAFKLCWRPTRRDRPVPLVGVEVGVPASRREVLSDELRAVRRVSFEALAAGLWFRLAAELPFGLLSLVDVRRD